MEVKVIPQELFDLEIQEGGITFKKFKRISSWEGFEKYVSEDNLFFICYPNGPEYMRGAYAFFNYMIRENEEPRKMQIVACSETIQKAIEYASKVRKENY